MFVRHIKCDLAIKSAHRKATRCYDPTQGRNKDRREHTRLVSKSWCKQSADPHTSNIGTKLFTALFFFLSPHVIFVRWALQILRHSNTIPSLILTTSCSKLQRIVPLFFTWSSLFLLFSNQCCSFRNWYSTKLIIMFLRWCEDRTSAGTHCSILHPRAALTLCVQTASYQISIRLLMTRTLWSIHRGHLCPQSPSLICFFALSALVHQSLHYINTHWILFSPSRLFYLSKRFQSDYRTLFTASALSFLSYPSWEQGSLTFGSNLLTLDAAFHKAAWVQATTRTNEPHSFHNNIHPGIKHIRKFSQKAKPSIYWWIFAATMGLSVELWLSRCKHLK